MYWYFWYFKVFFSWQAAITLCAMIDKMQIWRNHTFIKKNSGSIPKLSFTLSVCPSQNEIHFHGILSMKNCFQGVNYTEPDTIQIFYNSCGIINIFQQNNKNLLPDINEYL